MVDITIVMGVINQLSQLWGTALCRWLRQDLNVRTNVSLGGSIELTIKQNWISRTKRYGFQQEKLGFDLKIS